MSRGKRKNGKGKDRKQRSTSVVVDMGEPKTINAIRYSPGKGFGVLSPDGELLTPVHAYVENTYSREKQGKGPKVLNRVSIAAAPMVSMDLYAGLLLKDRIVAIDTNTRDIRGHRVSICCVVGCQLQVQKTLVLANYAPVFRIEFRNLEGKIENEAWRVAIEWFRANPNLNSQSKVGVIVDSDLGFLADYNARIKPVCRDYFLPSGFELLYGSSDVGKEYLPNILIAECDRRATELLSYIETLDEYLERRIDLPFRVWPPRLVFPSQKTAEPPRQNTT